MPLDAWVLLAASVGIGLCLEVAFFRAQRASRIAARDRAQSEKATEVDA